MWKPPPSEACSALFSAFIRKHLGHLESPTTAGGWWGRAMTRRLRRYHGHITAHWNYTRTPLFAFQLELTKIGRLRKCGAQCVGKSVQPVE